MSLLDGGMAEAFGEIFGGEYIAGQLLPVTLTKVSGGKLEETLGALLPCLYQPERTTQAMRESQGYTQLDTRFFVLQAGVTAGPLKDWELIDKNGARWAVQSVDQDPARSYWDLHTRPSRRVIAPDP